MTDAAFREAFEGGRLASFPHRDHVRLAWLYLRREPILPALRRFSEGLKHFAAAQGKPGLYHETITWAYMFLIRERMERSGAPSWPLFAAANPDLLCSRPSVLELYYRAETLSSDLARRAFVLPDRVESTLPSH